MSLTEGIDSAITQHSDGLSILCTRSEFMRHLRLSMAVSVAGKPSGMFAVLAINLSGFRKANMIGGRAAGDALLKEAARRISRCIGNENLAAHDGSDDFFALIRYSNRETLIRPMLKALSDVLSLPYQLPWGTLECPPRFGIASHPHDGTDAELLIRNAARAVQMSRSGTRGNTVFHNEGLQEDYSARMRMAEDLASALESNAFELHYQPIYAVDTRLLTGVEALLRWNHPEHGLIGPEVFLADAEESGLIADIGQWAFTEICRQARESIDAGQAIPVSLNLSPGQLPEFLPAKWLKKTMLDFKIPHELLSFELKADEEMVDIECMIGWMQDCRQLGIDIHLDEFTGSNPSLTLIASGLIGEIRIGRKLIRHLHTSTGVRTLIQAVIDYGRDSSTRISAVGIEDASTADTLSQMGCQSLQGYHLGRPSPFLRFPEVLPQIKPASRILRLVTTSGAGGIQR
jgi:diguanylate cyclase